MTTKLASRQRPHSATANATNNAGCRRKSKISRNQGILGKADTRKELFVEAYLSSGGNATKAAEAVGLKSPKMAGSRLLRDAKVCSLLGSRRAEALAKAKQDTDEALAEVMAQLKSIVSSDVREAFDSVTGEMLPVHKWPAKFSPAVGSIKFTQIPDRAGGGAVQTAEFKLWDKVAAIDRALKVLRAYVNDSSAQSTPREVPAFSVTLVRPGRSNDSN
jgi:phage terminase small subunit